MQELRKAESTDIAEVTRNLGELILMEPRGWFSWDYDLIQGGELLTGISLAWLREKGEFTLGGQSFSLFRDGPAGPFILSDSSGQVLAKGVKPSFLRRRFELERDGHGYLLEADSPFSNTFSLMEGAAVIGTIRCRRLLSWRGEARLSPDLPLPFRIFVLWLVIILWKREAQGAGGS